ncbi:MAG: radical SAM protein [Myxococcales bacterium]|nr:radical SAM protein [Myxococcales bacterium]
MRVLLINSNREQSPWPAAPIGLAMVARATAAAHHEVSFLDLAFVRNPARETRVRAAEFAPDVIGISIRNLDNCNFDAPRFYLDEVRDEVVRVARLACPRARIVIGGAAVNLAPWDILLHVEADFALAGEGEEALPAFLSALTDGADLQAVPGVLDRHGPKPTPDHARAFGGDRVFLGEPPAGRSIVTDFETGGRSDLWRWVDWATYVGHGAPYPIQTKRGCALRCVYCAYNNIEGRTYRCREPRLIVDEIEEAVREVGVRSIDFVDSTFNIPPVHAIALCEELARRKLPSDVELSTMGVNPAAMSTELLEAMKRAGFSNVMCTPESASNVTLKSLRKGFDRDQVIFAAEQLRKAGLKTLWFFLFGAPGETVATVKETLEFCERYIVPTDVALFTAGIRVYPGTPLEKQCKEQGWFDAADNLLRPSWYVAPTISVADMYRLLIEGAIDHPNWMTAAEGILNPGMVSFVDKGYRLLGGKGPLWARMPDLFRFMSRLGVRKKILMRMNDLLVSRTPSQLPHSRKLEAG